MSQIFISSFGNPTIINVSNILSLLLTILISGGPCCLGATWACNAIFLSVMIHTHTDNFSYDPASIQISAFIILLSLFLCYQSITLLCINSVCSVCPNLSGSYNILILALPWRTILLFFFQRLLTIK